MDEHQQGEVCIANIGPRERRKRLRFGQIAGVITVLVAGALVALHAAPAAALAVALPAAASAIGYFQAKEKT